MESKCSCKHDGQDKIYGAGIRWFNLDQKSTTGTCTVCSVKTRIK